MSPVALSFVFFIWRVLFVTENVISTIHSQQRHAGYSTRRANSRHTVRSPLSTAEVVPGNKGIHR